MDTKKIIRFCKFATYNITHTFFAWIPSLRIRRGYYRLFLGNLGKDCYIAMNVDIRQPIDIYIGDRVVINKHVVLDGRGGLTISNDVDIAQDSSIWTEDHDYNSPEHKSRTAPVAIADHVWIASRATILPGVTIKRGSVVATGAVVTKNVEELSIVGGVPAKVIGKRENKLEYKLSHKPKFWDYK